MRDGFEQYRAELNSVKLTENEKAALVRTLTERESARRPVRVLRTALIAAALCVACLALCAAGWVGYQTATGGQVYREGNYEVFSALNAEPPVEARDGRLWFVADGQEVDITDLIGEKTPYVYKVEDQNADYTNYVIVGGTVEDYGFADVLVYSNREPGNDLAVIDGGASWAYGAETAEKADVSDKEHPEGWKPWFLTGMEQLGLGW